MKHSTEMSYVLVIFSLALASLESSVLAEDNAAVNGALTNGALTNDAAANDAWSQIAVHFSPPERFAGDFGDYASPLRNADGTMVHTAQQWRQRRRELLEQWTGLLGKWPPLIERPKIEILESKSRDNFMQHKVRFQWTPDQTTTAYLLVPDGVGKRPAVVTVYYEPETAVGLKGEHRDFAYQLARRGFVTLSIGTTEATQAETYALYYPDIDRADVQPLSMLAYAAANAWYVLASRPEVDDQRIGIVGHSFGGKWAMFGGCLFDRFAAVAVSDPGIMFDTDPNVNYWEPWYLGWHPRPWRKRGVITADNPGRGLYPKLLEQGHDLHELHALLAPRPFLVSGGQVDPPRRWQALNHLVRINQLLGHSHRVGMTNRPNHAPNAESNAVIFAFFEHFLGAPAACSWLPPAPTLPPPKGQVIRVATVDQLFDAARDIRPGGTILVEDGHYMMPRYFELSTDRVTLRSDSGERDKVVLDGAESRHGELVGLRACTGVTIADLTIQNIRHNGFKLNSDTGVYQVTIRNCVIHNIWQRGVKGVRVPQNNAQVKPPNDCHIEHCLFYNDRPKTFGDDSTDTPDTFDGNYIGGIDVMYADSWTIRDNVFRGIRGRTGEARGAVFLWHNAVDCIVERNVIIDCDSGICLGNSHRGPDATTHCRGCIVRNNFLARCPENGILADYTKDCLIAHNTIHDPTSRLKRLIRLVHDNEGLAVVNNLLSGPPMQVETTSSVRIEGNVTRDETESFVDVTKGDLHLKDNRQNSVGPVVSLARVREDFDREPRRSSTNAGADQGSK